MSNMTCDAKLNECSADSGQVFDLLLIERLLPQLEWIAQNSIARQWQSKVGVSDIIQDTLMEATQTLPTFSGDTIGEFNQWLRAILTNNLRDARRKYVDAEKRTVDREESLNFLPSQLLEAKDPSPSRAAQSNEFDHELHKAIQTIMPVDRKILILRYRERLTFLEISNRLNINVDTVRKRWGRILAMLQLQLQSFDPRNTTRQS
ncbi:RNA polymerase sigma factor [Novipirellula sp.]|uniref:RNA polymerase sigma factor n=1 Tax=Novipirellula sp. TaxID=2795430 RepID=UPI00356A6492